MLSWHVEYAERSRRIYIEPKCLNDKSIPKSCKLNQEKLIELIEDTKFLFIQSQSILNYRETDILTLTIFLKTLFDKKIDKFV